MSARAKARAPRRVVALGGGTGMPAVLAGLRRIVSDGDDVTALTAVVTMSDDGGSSGRLRRTRGLPPPGDVRNCLVALSAETDLVAALFQHRYGGEEELGGHNLGNLILAALAEQTGSFLRAIEVSSRVLRTAGRILPATLEDVTLEALLEDGTTLVGESSIGACRKRIERVWLRPQSARATPGVVEAIDQADLVVLGPGSLFTSVVPNLLLDEVREALCRTRAVRILVGNLVSEGGEESGLQFEDHLRVIEAHAGAPIVDALLAHRGSVPTPILARYRDEGAELLEAPPARLGRVQVFARNLIADCVKLRHEPQATAMGLVEAWRELAAQRAASVGTIVATDPGTPDAVVTPGTSASVAHTKVG